MIPLPAGPLLFDTGIYIRFSRGEDYLWMVGKASWIINGARIPLALRSSICRHNHITKNSPARAVVPEISQTTSPLGREDVLDKSRQ